MRPVFHVGAAAEANVALAVHSHHQHIRIVEAAGRRHTQLVNLADGNVLEGLVIILDIAGGAVHMDADGLHPLPWFLHAPVAGGEENLPAGGFQSHAHGVVTVYAVSAFREVAEIVFQEVNAPFGKGFGVDELVIVTGGVSGTGAHAGAGIHTEF